jgi:hypothetical protein
LQDFYERCVADQVPQVQAFLEEELLTDSGYRESMALERAQKALRQRGAPATAIDVLVKRRLLHVEERLQIRRIELTHDVLTEIVKKSRDKRQRLEQSQQAELREQNIRQQLRQSRTRLAITVGLSAFLFGVVAASIYWYLDSRVWEHVAHYNTYTKSYGVPVGIGELTATNVAARKVSFRFTRKGRKGPVLKLEAVNRFGKLTPEHGVGTYLRQASESKSPTARRECQWEFVYDKDGRVVYEKSFDKSGNMVWGFVYSPMSSKDRAHGHFVGPNGYPQAQRNSAAEYVEIEYTQAGWERFKKYYDRERQRQPGPDRAFGQFLEYNEQGLFTRMMSVDANDQFMIDSAGNAGMVLLRFDELGNVLEAS